MGYVLWQRHVTQQRGLKRLGFEVDSTYGAKIGPPATTDAKHCPHFVASTAARDGQVQ
jgi:hypothetical protein